MQSIAQTRGDGQHIFHRAAGFHADDVFIRIHAQFVCVKSIDQSLSDSCVSTGSYQSSGLTGCHFLRKTRSAQHAGQHGRGDQGLHLVGHQTVS